jgi:hypothetical protein
MSSVRALKAPVRMYQGERRMSRSGHGAQRSLPGMMAPWCLIGLVWHSKGCALALDSPAAQWVGEVGF